MRNNRNLVAREYAAHLATLAAQESHVTLGRGSSRVTFAFRQHDAERGSAGTVSPSLANDMMLGITLGQRERTTA